MNKKKMITLLLTLCALLHAAEPSERARGA